MRDVRVPDARQCLNGVTARLLGTSPQVLALNPWEENGLKAVLCPCQDGRKLVMTPVPSAQFVKAVQVKSRNRLAKAEVGQLGDRPQPFVMS
jgi:hypothetical protein